MSGQACSEVDKALVAILQDISSNRYFEGLLGWMAGKFYHESYLSYRTRDLKMCAFWSKKKLFLSLVDRPKNVKKFLKVVFSEIRSR